MKEIPLTQGYVAFVDDEDFERVNAFKWHAYTQWRKGAKQVYVRRNAPRDTGGYRSEFLHQFLTGQKRIDHQDNDGLNNQRHNLRSATPSQNAANAGKSVGRSSRYKGVTWNGRRNKWRAEIMLDHKKYFLGRFREECDAALAYNLKADELFGEFARFNVPLEANA